MTDENFCRVCGNPVKPKRDDKQFCSDRCAAKWARDQGYERERFHAEKEEWIKKNCQQCGTTFVYNEYAKRAGQRVPKFCSNACRQAAYRQRKAEAGQNAGYTAHWDDARNDKTEKGTSQKTRSKSQTGNKGTQQETYAGRTKEQMNQEWADVKQEYQSKNKGTSQQTSTNKGTQQPPIPNRWKSKDAYEILGVSHLSTAEQIKRAWKKLLRTYHPDVSSEPHCNEITKKINWAYNRIENAGKRR